MRNSHYNYRLDTLIMCLTYVYLQVSRKERSFYSKETEIFSNSFGDSLEPDLIILSYEVYIFINICLKYKYRVCSCGIVRVLLWIREICPR